MNVPSLSPPLPDQGEAFEACGITVLGNGPDGLLELAQDFMFPAAVQAIDHPVVPRADERRQEGDDLLRPLPGGQVEQLDPVQKRRHLVQHHPNGVRLLEAANRQVFQALGPFPRSEVRSLPGRAKYHTIREPRILYSLQLLSDPPFLPWLFPVRTPGPEPAVDDGQPLGDGQEVDPARATLLVERRDRL